MSSIIINNFGKRRNGTFFYLSYLEPFPKTMYYMAQVITVKLKMREPFLLMMVIT